MTAYAGTAEFSTDIPEALQQSFDNQQETERNTLSSEPYSISAQPRAFSTLGTGSWWDSAAGPGTLQYQYDPEWSDALSGFGSGYMTSINYNWSGNLNGWSKVEAHLCIENPFGTLLGCANVSNTPTGSISLPYGSYAANNKLRFAFLVNQAPKLRIYGGPSFNYVSASVEYQ